MHSEHVKTEFLSYLYTKHGCCRGGHVVNLIYVAFLAFFRFWIRPGV